MGELTGAVALVTGAARGQGAEQAHRLTTAGATVIGIDVTAGDASASGVELIQGDVSDAEMWARAVARAESRGPLRVLVNNAAIHYRRAIELQTAADMLRLLEINLVGPMLGIQAAAPAITRAGGGAIVNVASIAAVRGFAGLAAYGASKAGLLALARTAVLEYGPAGIRVNTILPGAIDTPMMTGAAGDARFASLPLGRCGTVADVSELVAFLTSDRAAYITGAEIVIDGGSTVGRVER